MFASLKPYRKALVAGVVAAGAVLWTALSDDVVTAQEWAEIVLAGLSGSGITYLVPNTPKPPAAPRRWPSEEA